MKNAADIRTDAIALLAKKLREIGAEADQQTKQHREAEKSPAALADFRTFCDHREAAALNYALAYRCEQLVEEITGALLFDELDAQDEAAEAARAAEHEGLEELAAEQAARAADEDGDESRFTRAQLDGEACTECGIDFAEGQPTVPSGYDFIEGQLFAHAACAEREASL